MSEAGATVDLNSDLGEGFGIWTLGDDQALLGVVTSANVACGFHAGDPTTLRRTCADAVARGVGVQGDRRGAARATRIGERRASDPRRGRAAAARHSEDKQIEQCS